MPAHRQLIYIYGMLLRRRELDEHFDALSRLVPMTFDNVFHWRLTAQCRLGAARARSRTSGGSSRPTRPTAGRGWRWPRPCARSAVGRRRRGCSPSCPSRTPTPAPSAPGSPWIGATTAAVVAILAGGPADHPELARLRGRFALAHRDGPAAVRHFRDAYAAEPDDRDTVFGLGTALALVGDHAAAAPLLRDSRAYDMLAALMTRAANPANRKDTTLMRALGAACEAVRRFPEARAWYDLAVRTDPSDHEAQKALYRFDSR